MKDFPSAANGLRAVIVALIFVFGRSALPAGQEFEMIYELDLSFFLVNPKRAWAGDPFEKYAGFAAVAEGEEKFVLSLIISASDGEPEAVINNQKVRIGDRIGSRVVSDIGDNFVTLKRGGSEFELNLPSPQQNADYGEDDDEGEDEDVIEGDR